MKRCVLLILAIVALTGCEPEANANIEANQEARQARILDLDD
jgi:hypothetical protein